MADATSSTAQVLLVIHAPTVPICSERRLPSQAAIAEIQQRLELLSGIPPESQQLSLWTTRTDDMDSHARLVTEIPLPQQQGIQKRETTTTLASLGARDGMGLKVLDARGATVSNQFSTEEEERVQKFELDDAAYAQRTDSVLAFKKRNKIGRFAEADIVGSDGNTQQADSSASSAADVSIGARCEVDGFRRATVRYVGTTAFAPGNWIGVEYDEPVGKNDGQVGAGPRYFSCRPKHGGFVRPEKVVIGNFAERGLDEDDEDEEM